MIAATHEPKGVRHDEPYEADRARAGDADPDDQRRHDIQNDLEATYVDTEVEGTLFTDGKEVEWPRQQDESDELLDPVR